MMMLKLVSFLVASPASGNMDLSFRTCALIPGAASCLPHGDAASMLQRVSAGAIRPSGVGELYETLLLEDLLAEVGHEAPLSDDSEPLAERSDFAAGSDVQSLSQKE
mmetsp:Transcript_96848/g.273727  ORF Transcript_96848/g.273727 Transcript_96848/m.273727 type:complete len:107 (+) Transcript_96848:77-397(+)